jgi:AcrR family transcriptional regulator
MAEPSDGHDVVPSARAFINRLGDEIAPRSARASSARRPRGRPVDADGERTRRNIIEAALVCFGRAGYDRTTNSQIAEEAGISPPTLYHYFDSKAALLQAAALDVTQTFYGRIDELVAERSSTADRFAAVVDVLGEQIEDRPHLAGFIATYAAEVRRSPDLLRLSPTELWTGPIHFYADIARSGQRRGDVAGDIDPMVLASLVMGLIYGVSLLVSVAPTESIAEVIAAYDRLIRGTLFDE